MATVAAITRGRSNAIPGTIMFALFGFFGQIAVNKFTSTRETRAAESQEGFWKRMGDKKWTPFTVLNDEQYVAMLKERLFKVDVELAVIDEKIAALKDEQTGIVAQQLPGTVNTKQKQSETGKMFLLPFHRIKKYIHNNERTRTVV